MLIRILSVSLLSILSSSSLIECRLLSSQVISRHGTRAPNPVVEKLCHADSDNLLRYHSMDISAAGLTGNGMKELKALGQATRKHYDGFLSTHFDNTEIFVQGVAEDRTLQSAIAWGHGLFPPDSTPGYDPTLPVPLPVYSIPNGKDNVLEVRKAACKQRLKKEVAQWDLTEGQKLWSENSALLNKLGDICGVDLKQAIKGSGDNYGDAIKDITDAFMFDYQEHFVPLNGLTLAEFAQFRAVAVKQLLGRILGTKQQRTYMNGELPDTIIANFRESVSPTGLKVSAYHGHREMLYAIAAFLGVDFDIQFPGLPKGAIPPATTLFLDLVQNDSVSEALAITSASKEIETSLQKAGYKIKQKADISGNTVNVDRTSLNENDEKNLFVRVSLWVPCYVNSTIEDGSYTLGSITNGADCPLQPQALSTCDGKVDCPFDQFITFIVKQIEETGDWQSLCEFKSNSDLAEQLQLANLTQQHLHTAVSLFSIGFCLAAIATVTLAAVLICRQRMMNNQSSSSSYNNVSDFSDDDNRVGSSYQRTTSITSRFNENSSLLNANANRNTNLIINSNIAGYRSEDSLP